MSTLILHNPFNSLNDVIAPLFSIKKEKKSKGGGIFQTFTKGVNKNTIKKLDKLLVEMDDVILKMKSCECDYSSKKDLEWIEEGKFVLKMIETIASLVSMIDDEKDDISMEMANQLNLIANKIETILILAETYNEVKAMKEEISKGKTINSIDEAFTI